MTHGHPLVNAREDDSSAAGPGVPGQRPRALGSAARGRAQRRARLAVAALLLALIALGIRAADPSLTGRGPLHRDGKVLGLALELALLALVAAVSLRRRRSPHASHAASLLNTMLRTGLWIGVIALPVVFILNTVHRLPRRPLVGLGSGKGRQRHARLPRATSTVAGHVVVDTALWLLAIVLLVALVVCVIQIWRWRRPVRSAGPDTEPDEDFSAGLSRAVESGRRALAESDDARTAIIACYVAMEDSLADVGAVRAAAETPDELLRRAVAGGVVRGAAAGRLTALFYEARFSTHPLPPSYLAAARQALAEIAAELTTRRTAQALLGGS